MYAPIPIAQGIKTMDSDVPLLQDMNVQILVLGYTNVGALANQVPREHIQYVHSGQMHSLCA